MKIFKNLSVIILSIGFIISCSNDNKRPSEVRFVDLQGNPRPIKTRVPEANAKIMSGQSDKFAENSSVINNEYVNNQKNIGNNSLVNDRFVNEDKSFADNNPRINNSSNINVKNFDKNSGADKYQQSNPVIEYDLSNDEKSLKSKKFSDSQSVDLQQESPRLPNKNKLIEDENQDLVEINLNDQRNSNNKMLVKKPLDADKNSTNLTSNNVKRIYSQNNSSDSISDENSNVLLDKKSLNKKNLVQQNDSEDPETIIIKQSSASSSGGRFYVQVGAFQNSESAKERLMLIKNQGKGKIMVGYFKGKKIYRSVFGPFKLKSKANAIKDQIISAGNDAIIYKN